jgi:hypothetical protein
MEIKMARNTKHTIPVAKIVATTGGAFLTGAAVWLNASHVAGAEGWFSPLVAAGIIVTLCAAVTPPFAERAIKNGDWLKAIGLCLYFTLAVAFSLTASISRSGGYRDAQVASGEAANRRSELAAEAYKQAQATMRAECSTGRGRRCRAAEQSLEEARKALSERAEVKPVDSGADRLAAILHISPQTVQRYAPLSLPFALELGGYILLAFGLAPRRQEKVVKLRRKKRKSSPKPKPRKALGENVVPLRKRVAS